MDLIFLMLILVYDKVLAKISLEPLHYFYRYKIIIISKRRGKNRKTISEDPMATGTVPKFSYKIKPGH